MDIVAIGIHHIGSVVPGKYNSTRAAAEIVRHFRTLVGDDCVRIAIKCDCGGHRVFGDHLDGLSNSNIIPGHIDLPVGGKQARFAVLNGHGTATFCWN